MAQAYADRAFLSVNGAKFADLQSANLNQNFNSKAVASMTPDKFNRGFVQGNTDIDLDFEIAVQNALATPKVESIDFANSSVQITFQCGADLYTATDIFVKTAKTGASGIGQEAKKTWTFGALKLLDAVGNAANAISSISL